MIETQRLILRPLDPSDAQVLAVELNTLAISQWTARIPFPYRLEDAREFLALCAVPAPGTLVLAITCKQASGVLRGVISYEGDGTGSAELGYWVSQSEWRKGFGREAAEAITSHVFSHTGYGGLSAGYREGNIASQRILEGLGFTPEGRSKVFCRALGEETPVVRLRLTRDDWRQAAEGRR